ncbi:MAG: hypothetical protein CL987_03085 [Euryarchaeota archaeon]|nr:hypothetical protein [Euryarchaeota archaeon]
MAGTEGEDESTENAMRPPQSVVISSTEADEIPKSVDPPLLTGTVVAADVHAQTVSQPIAQSQLQYVMGPDGQMYAYEKAPFNWKHFCLGFFIPVGIIFAQLLLSVILTEDYDYYDYVQNIELEFTKYEGSALSLSLPPSNDYVIKYCSISGEDFEAYFCQFWDNDNISITKAGTSNQVGTVYKTNNTMYLEENFPSGNYTIFYEYVDQSRYQEWIELQESESVGVDMMGFVCCFLLVINILGSIISFVTGRKDMGIGFLLSFIAVPIIAGLGSIAFLW